MKILFINPPYTNLAGINESAGHMMPLCFGYLAAYLRERINGIKFKICDAEAKGANFDDIKKTIKNFDPDVVAITSPTPAIRYVYKIVEMAKQVKKDAYIVLGGIHPTVMMHRTMQECELIDFIVVGEGEETFYQLIKSLNDKKMAHHQINGLCFRIDGKIISTPHRGLIPDLNTIPFPARDLYDLELYRSAPTKKVSDENATPILTSRGCTYNCIHCPSRTIWGRSIRYRSPDNVIQEIEQCVNEFGLREFNFFDDTFTINKKRVIEICEKILQRKMDIVWICFARANAIDDQLVNIMKKAGCRKISFGLESGDQHILDLMRKKINLADSRKAVQTVIKAGIPVHGSFMIGNVGETEKSIKESIKFAKSLNLDNATFFITTPFPGTDLYEIAKDLGSITTTTSWESFAPLTNAPPILVQENLSKDQLIFWQKKAFREFYLRPAYIFKKTKLLLSLSGIKTLLEGFRILMRILKKKVA
jgi:anaerobic magnesium-protoporphyrin IX monomethyl ester cyclase